MSKLARKIVARGLTASDRGKTIEFSTEDGRYQQITVEDIRYNPLNGTTLVKHTSWAEIPNMNIVTVSS